MFKLKNKRDVLIKEFDTLKEVSKFLEVSQQRLIRYLNGFTGTSYIEGYIFTYEDDILEPDASNDVTAPIQVQFDIDKIKSFLKKQDLLKKEDLFKYKILESKYPYKVLVEEYLKKDDKVTVDLILPNVWDVNINNQSNYIIVWRCFSYRQIIETIIEERKRCKIMIGMLNRTKEILKDYQ